MNLPIRIAYNNAMTKHLNSLIQPSPREEHEMKDQSRAEVCLSDRDNEWNSNAIQNGIFVNAPDITIKQDQPCNVTDEDSLWNQQIVERRAQHLRSP